MLITNQQEMLPLPTLGGFYDELAFLSQISGSYPGFSSWFNTKVVLGVMCGTRYITKIERHGSIVAIGIAKNEDGEKKLCTIRVSPECEGRGYGLRVLDTLLSWLETDMPLATVSEEKMPAFSRIFERYGFVLSSAERGLYRPDKVEFIFNKPVETDFLRTI